LRSGTTEQSRARHQLVVMGLRRETAPFEFAPRRLGTIVPDAMKIAARIWSGKRVARRIAA
jgi:hypothetical protein